MSTASDFEHQLTQLNKAPTFSPRAYAALQAGLLVEILKRLQDPAEMGDTSHVRGHMTTFDDWVWAEPSR